MDRSHTRSSFLGGEWSPSALGRLDLPNYDTTLSISSNGYPVEEGAWTKRGGTMYVGPTKNGYQGIVRSWYLATAGTDPTQLQSVLIELSYGPGSTGGAATLQVWRWPFTNNTPVFSIAAPYTSLQEIKIVDVVAVDNGVFFLSKNTKPWILRYNPVGDTFLFQDALFENLNGPYLDPLFGASQTLNSLGTISGTGAGAVTFTITDGNYSFTSSDIGRAIRLWNQPVKWDSSTAYTGGQVVTYDGNYWSALQNAPAGNIPGTQVPIGNFIVVPWALVPQQGTWAYGQITAITSASVCTVNLTTGLPNAKSAATPGGNGLVIDTWQLGVYTQNQYPACGVWHEGRLWLGGALPSRIDCSAANGLFTTLVAGGAIIGANGGLGPIFSPTDQYGTVADNNGISEVFNSEGTNMPLWMASEQAGIILGTAQAEWLISASNLNDPLTPTSIQIHKITKYGSAKTRAVRVGIAMAFIQTFGRRVMELVADVFSGRFIGRHINEYAKHLSSYQFRELAYQEEPSPLIWARDAAGYLYSCTYRRTSHFGQEDPKFMAWSRHQLSSRFGGTASRVASVSDASLGGVNLQSQSSIALVTGTVGASSIFTNCQIELVQPYTEPSTNFNSWNVWHVDGGVSGATGGTLTISDAAAPGVRMIISGIPGAYNGSTVSVFLCGLDFGDFFVSNGTVTVPYASDPDKLGTAAFIAANYVFFGTNSLNWTYWSTPAVIGGVNCWLPCVVGYTFTSQMQVTRPASRDASEGKTGAGFGKTQRTHMWGGTFAQTASNGLVVSAKMTTGGQDASSNAVTTLATAITDYPVVFRYPTGNAIPVSTLYNGVFWDTINGDYNFDNQITLTSTRPVPFTVASLTGFMAIEDR